MGMRVRASAKEKESESGSRLRIRAVGAARFRVCAMALNFGARLRTLSEPMLLCCSTRGASLRLPRGSVELSPESLAP